MKYLKSAKKSDLSTQILICDVVAWTQGTDLYGLNHEILIFSNGYGSNQILSWLYQYHVAV